MIKYHATIDTHKAEMFDYDGKLCVGGFVEIVIVAILFKIRFTQINGSFCFGAVIVVFVEHF
jgi:hypothetical protein